MLIDGRTYVRQIADVFLQFNTTTQEHHERVYTMGFFQKEPVIMVADGDGVEIYAEFFCPVESLYRMVKEKLPMMNIGTPTVTKFQNRVIIHIQKV